MVDILLQLEMQKNVQLQSGKINYLIIYQGLQ